MYNIQFKREPNYKENQYCILQFKGKFQTQCTDQQGQQKNLVHLGQLKKIAQGKYKLQIGVMDIIGKQVKLTTKQIVTQTIQGKDNISKKVFIKGVITKKIVFQGRPAPDMLRATVIKRDGANHKMFSKMQQKNQITEGK